MESQANMPTARCRTGWRKAGRLKGRKVRGHCVGFPLCPQASGPPFQPCSDFRRNARAIPGVELVWSSACIEPVDCPKENAMNDDLWPALPYEAWKDTYDTLHMWSKMVGKVALALAPPENHGWGIALHLTERGMATRLLPHEARSFSLEFD